MSPKLHWATGRRGKCGGLPLLLLFLLLGKATCTTTAGLDLRGAGSSVMNNLFNELAFQYKYDQPEVDLSFAGTGSSRGLCLMKDPSACDDNTGEDQPTEVDFALSGVRLSDADKAAYNLQMYPLVGTAMVPVYNLPELQHSSLKLSLGVLSRIYRCDITHWNDPAIQELNPSTASLLPDAPIQIVTQVDRSGSTEMYRDVLAMEDPLFAEEVATGGGEDTPTDWPCSRGNPNFHFRRWNDGVAAFLLSTPRSLGFISYGSAQSTGAHMASLQQGASEVLPNHAQISEAMESLPLRLEDDLSSSRPVPSSGWPLVGYTYFVLRSNAEGNRLRAGASCAHVKATLRFLIWALSSDIAWETIEAQGFSPNPPHVRAQIVANLMAQTECDGEPAIRREDLEGASFKFQLNMPGTVPNSLYQELHSLPLAYKAQDLSVQVELLHGVDENCTQALYDWEWFRLSTCNLSPESLSKNQVEGFTGIPFAVHPYAAVANIPGISQLVLDMPAISAIMKGEVTRFNDPMLLRLNPELAAVEEPLILVQSHENHEIFFNVDGMESYHVDGDAGHDGGCALSTGICLDRNTGVALAVSEQAYALGVVPLATITADFQGIVVDVMVEGANGPEAVTPSIQAIQACMAKDTSARSCYPLTLTSTLVLRTDYYGINAELAAKAIEFWAWVMREPGIAAQLETSQHRWQFYHAGPRQRNRIDALLTSLMVNGEAVLASGGGGRVAVVLVASLCAIAAVCVAASVVFGAFLLYRNRQLGRAVQEMKTELNDINRLEWDVNSFDVEAPITKTLNFLKRLAEQGGAGSSQQTSEEAKRLHRLMLNSNNLQIPAGLHRESDGTLGDVPIAMRYLMGLSARANRYDTPNRMSMSASRASIDVGYSSCGGSYPESSDEGSQGMMRSSWWDGAVDVIAEDNNTAVPHAALDLHGLGTSMFCNVMHLRELGIHNPLAFVTVNVLRNSGLMKTLRLDEEKLRRYLTYVESAYVSTNPYHNNWHAADVTQRCAAILNALPLPDNKHTRTARLSVILAAAMHDAAHPGVDNNFLMKQEDAIARSFNDQHVLEMHSLCICLHAIQDVPEYNFLEGSALAGKTNWLKIKNTVIKTVLATDMSQHFDLVAKFSANLAGLDSSDPGFSEKVDSNLQLMLSVSMKAADIGHCTARWATHQYWSKCLEEEFFLQGDKERAADMQLSPMMNRHGKGCMAPSSQIGFFDFIVMPFYTTLAKTFPGLGELATQAGANYRRWKSLDMMEVEMPLVGVDHYEKLMAGMRSLETLEDAEDQPMQVLEEAEKRIASSSHQQRRNSVSLDLARTPRKPIAKQPSLLGRGTEALIGSISSSTGS